MDKLLQQDNRAALKQAREHHACTSVKPFASLSKEEQALSIRTLAQFLPHETQEELRQEPECRTSHAGSETHNRRTLWHHIYERGRVLPSDVQDACVKGMIEVMRAMNATPHANVHVPVVLVAHFLT